MRQAPRRPSVWQSLPYHIKLRGASKDLEHNRTARDTLCADAQDGTAMGKEPPASP